MVADWETQVDLARQYVSGIRKRIMEQDIEAEWDVTGDYTRELFVYQAQPLQLDREYTVWLAFDKPMRWRENGANILIYP